MAAVGLFLLSGHNEGAYHGEGIFKGQALSALEGFRQGFFPDRLLKASFQDEVRGQRQDISEPTRFVKSDRLRRNAQDVAMSKDVQTEYPTYQEPQPRPQRKPNPGLARLLSRVAVIIAAGAGVALLLIIAFKLWRAKGLSKEKPGKEKSEKEVKEDQEKLKKALAKVGTDAQSLASEGRYSEAIHTLLLESLEEYRRRRGKEIPAPLTGRELVGALPLNQEENACFKDLVDRSEPIWFGPMEGDKEGFDGAYSSFGRLLASLGKDAGAPPGAPRTPAP
ncbi:MAG: hypothetical protein LBF40_00785 [Deltaproteobacteria bacterium]|nr:hypothetical protein [Deltaproteobacteria bacterium]